MYVISTWTSGQNLRACDPKFQSEPGTNVIQVEQGQLSLLYPHSPPYRHVDFII